MNHELEDKWDEQIADDLEKGRLDKLIAEVEEEIATMSTDMTALGD